MRPSMLVIVTACAAVWLAASPQTAVAQEPIALQSVQNGLYVRTGAGAHGFLAAVSPQIDWREKFYLTRLGGSEVALPVAPFFGGGGARRVDLDQGVAASPRSTDRTSEPAQAGAACTRSTRW
jgi:hypothetical protein